jgi:O-antigen ligase
VRTWAISATAWAVVMIVGVITNQRVLAGFTPRAGRRASLTLGDANLAANYFVTSLLVMIAAGYPVGRVRRFLASALMITGIVLTGSNGGLLTLVLALGIVAIRGSWLRWGALVTVAVLALGTVAVVTEAVSCTDAGRAAGMGAVCQVHPTHLINAAQNSSNQVIRELIGRGDQSTGDRRLLLGETFSLYRNGGALLGQGPTAIKPALARRQSPYVKEAHNDLVAALVERGALGAVALAVMIAAIGLRTMSCSPSAVRRGRFALVVPRPEALVAAVLAMAMAAWFYEILHDRHLWALLGVVAAIHHWGGEAER